MRLISQDGTFDVPYDQVVIQRYSDGIYEDYKIDSESSEEKAIQVMQKLRENYKNFTLYKEDFLYFRFPEDEEVQE